MLGNYCGVTTRPADPGRRIPGHLAIERLTNPMSSPRSLKNYIGGEFAPARSDATTDLVNPATGEVVAHAPVSSEADVDAAYAAAEKAFAEWGQTTPGERQAALLKIADEIEARGDELVRLEAENTGKPYALTASEEIPPMVDQLRFLRRGRAGSGGQVGRRVHGWTHELDPS